MMKHQVADRLFFGCFALALSAVALSERDTVSYALVRGNGAPAELGVMALCVLAVMALLDTFVNDVLPDTYSFKTGVRFRQIVWLGIAVAFASHAFVIVKQGLGFSTALMYLLCCARCAAISFMDLHREFQDKRREAEQQRRDRRAGDHHGAINA
jgi:hypothetical protein